MATTWISRESSVRGVTGGASIDLMPLGIATRFIADDTLLLDAAIARLAGGFAESGAANPEIIIRLHWTENAADKVGFGVVAEGSSLRVSGRGATGLADATLGTALGEVPRGLGQDHEAIGDLAETLLLFLLTRSGRPPVHAASIVIGDVAVLLAGPSGSGKSSLALAAQRHGLDVLSEDTTYVQLDPPRAWGWPGPIHLLAADAPAGNHAARLRGGRHKLAIPRGRCAVSADRLALVAIERGPELAIERASRKWLLERLAPVEPGFDLLRAPIEAALGTIAADGGWRMTLDDHPDHAIALLRELFT
jgi:hypothetical protein